jgi:hypothetical protein
VGEGPPGAGRRRRGRGDLSPAMSERPAITVEALERWVENGATWRALELTDGHAVVELCTCYGEPVDQLESDAPELIEFVRTHAEG